MIRKAVLLYCGVVPVLLFAATALALDELSWASALGESGPETALPDPAIAQAPPPAPCPKPVPKPYKGLFFDNDFSYLDDPGNTHWYLGDALKRHWFGPCIVLDAGGEYRIRHENQHILSRRSDFLLQRTRLYADLHVGGWFRAYVEGIDAVSNFEDAPPRAIDENRFDALNLFGDVKLLEGPGGAFWFRGGRQELLYGVERLVSPLDWANTRRTFDGLKLFWQGADWNVDAWWTRPVPLTQHVAGGQTDHNFDHPDQSREFVGVWATCKRYENHKFDFYYLRLNEYDRAVDTFDYNTFGARWKGKLDAWLWEFQGGYQFGGFNADTQSAGFYTCGFGRQFPDLLWKPVFWVYYDWASGDGNPGDGIHATFNQLYPLAHKYFGFMDILARQNIEDWNFRLTATPHEKVKLLLWWHIFHLQQSRDAMYNAAGNVLRYDPTGAAGTDVGQELDLTVVFLLTPRCDLLFGYSHLYSGDFIRNTRGGVGGEDFYYGQCRLRF
jgi:hypothetical protein